MHQRTRTSGASRWGNISVDPKFFAWTSKAFTGSEIIPPRIGQILRPSRADAVELQRQHTVLCRLVESKPQTIKHPEVARAIEHDFIHALVNCLTADIVHADTAARRRRAAIINRFEEVLAEKFDRQLPMPELCNTVGVAERSVRECCLDFLGVSPSHYMRLRRLNLMHVALHRADPATAKIAEIAAHYGFSELGRLAGIYRAVFGEMPLRPCVDHARVIQHLPNLHSAQ